MAMLDAAEKRRLQLEMNEIRPYWIAVINGALVAHSLPNNSDKHPLTTVSQKGYAVVSIGVVDCGLLFKLDS